MATLGRFQRTITDVLGNIMPGATVEVRREDNLSRLANIYSDRQGVVPMDNPFTVGDDAFAAFHARGGAFRIMASQVIEGETYEIEWKYVPIGTAGELDFLDGITGGTLVLFDPATADADPGEGSLRINNATHASATEIYLDDLNIEGDSIADLIESWDDIGAANCKGYLRVQVDGDPLVWREFVITGEIVDATGYKKLPVDYVDGAGDLLGGEQLALHFSPAGPGRADQVDFTPAGNLVSDNVQDAIEELGTEKVAKAGDTMLGALSLHADPSSAMHAATKQYVDNLAAGLDPKASCIAATTANITLSGEQAIDTVAVTAGKRVLVKDQTAPAENGIYLCAAGAWTRATDANTWDELISANVWIEQGSANVDRAFVCTINDGGTLGTTAVTWILFGGTGAFQPLNANLTAESGLTGAADRVSYYTGLGTKALATFTSFGRTLLALADYAALKTGLGYMTASTDNRLVRTDGATGGLQQTGITINDNDDVSGVRNLAATGAVTLSGDITPTTLSAQADDYAPTGFSTAARIRQDSTTNVVITGLAGGADGRRVTIHNIGANTITLMNEDASSTAANRFKLDANVAISAGKSIEIEYDGTDSRWRVIGGVGGGGGAGVFTLSYESGELSISDTGSHTLTHALGVEPKIIFLHLVCKTAELGYSVGDKVAMTMHLEDYANNAGQSITFDNTEIFVRYSTNAVVYGVIHKTNGTSNGITPANWRLVVRAYA